MSNTPTKHPVVYLPVIEEISSGISVCKINGHDISVIYDVEEVGQVYLFTEEQLLDLKKKWAADAFDAGEKRGNDQQYVADHKIGQVFSDKQEYINNLKIN